MDPFQNIAGKDSLYPPDPSVLAKKAPDKDQGLKKKKSEERGKRKKERKTPNCPSEADCQDGKIAW